MVAKDRKTKKRGSRQDVVFSVFIAFLFLAVAGFLVFSNLKISRERTEKLKTIEELQEEIRALEEKNANLKAGLIQTESDIYWEEKAREQGYKKPGEEAVVVLPPEEANQEEPAGEKNFWQKFLEKIGF